MVSIKTDYVISPGTAKTTGHILVIHATADNNATAANIAAYEHRTWHSAFVHYAVDDKGAYQIGKPGYKAYGAGNVNKYAPVQIELCQFTDKTRARKAYSNFVALVKQMCAKYGIPLTLDSSDKTAGIKSHDWCRKTYGGTTHTDPWAYLTSIGISKAQLAKDLKAKTTSKPATKSSTKSTSKVDGYWGPATTLALQKVYNMKYQDGKISGQGHNAVTDAITGITYGTGGSPFVTVLQKHAGVKQDGKLGPATLKAMQKKMGTGADGKLSKPSAFVKAIQKDAFAGKKPF
ncbi:peptidoglycan recognition protein family protein [Lacticaseibacillus sharpeae]|uniref:N-acetylmuramoyl-L-alanine amidase domain-containing protein n=1 Tax=Lacticaseibacillus sharpeae JCM 1186 = DSM 20505 TaxID=1291052 RepID=A0A0R1ZIS5_9LACO|nr:peptidoglycan recognition family protein [Lacticaseibacillus sharpeae]KRM54830.1 hypothetical protein FC18_GL002247 [Lacticaseibacillus sharpeae JCM 1186 = DSM 20505]